MTRPLSRPLTRAIERAARLMEVRTRRWPATLGDPAGVVDVPGKRGFVYVLMPDGTVAVAYNVVTPHTPNLPVWVGYRPWNPAFLTVLDFVAAYPSPSPTTGAGPHHQTHEWLNAAGGNDVVYSHARQILPLRVSPVADLEVKVEPGAVLLADGTFAPAPTGTLDLAAYVPSATQCYVLVYLDADGALAARAGASIGAFASLAYTDIPAALPGEIALAAIALSAGQTTITETQARQDVVDLRFAFQPLPVEQVLTFLELTDTPADYTGDGGKAVTVADTEDALEFTPVVDLGDDAAELDTLNFLERASNPATPASGHWRLFTKSGGLYLMDDAGAVIGPFGVGDTLALDSLWDAKGDLVAATGANAAARLAVGTNTQMLAADSTQTTGVRWVNAPPGELLMADGTSNPPVPLENEDGDDWLYGEAF